MAIETFIAGPAGSYAAIGAMAVATYLCRASGVALMSRLRLTPRVTRAVKALPGSIVVATVAPLAAQAGLAAMAGVLAALTTLGARRLLVESSSRSTSLFKRDLFRKPVATFRDHASFSACA